MKYLKNFEIQLRKAIIWLLKTDNRNELVIVPKNVLEGISNPKILLLRQDRIGDVLVSTPIISSLRQKFPQAKIDILLSNNNKAVLPAIEHLVSDCLLYTKTVVSLIHIVQRIRAERYDCIVDLMDNPSSTSTALLYFSLARFKIGIEKSNGWVYTHCVPLLDRKKNHIVERIAQLLMCFGIDILPSELHLSYGYSKDERQSLYKSLLESSAKRVFINISGSRDNVWWGVENFIEFVANVGKKLDIEFWIGSSPDYLDEVKQIVNATSAKEFLPSRSFHDFAMQISCFDFLVTPDTSIVHVGAAFKIPTLVFFRQHDENLMPWYPYNSINEACIVKGEKTIKEISVDEAVAKFVHLVDKANTETKKESK